MLIDAFVIVGHSEQFNFVRLKLEPVDEPVNFNFIRLKLAPANFKLEFFILVFIIIMLKSKDYVISDLFIRSFIIIINNLNNAMIS